MKMPQIRLTSQLAQIGMQQIKGKQYIEQPKADLSIQQPKAEMSIQSKPAKLTIDQTQAWEETNLMSTPRHIEKFAHEGLTAALEGAGRRAEQGTELMKIEQQGNPIVEQAIRNGYQQMKPISMKYIPSPFAVKINVEPAELQIDTMINKPNIQAIPQKPIHHYERGSLQIYMEQYEQLQIDFVNLFSELA